MTHDSPPVVSVIVLNFNGRQWLAGCLDALAVQQHAPPFETILVDNASADGSATIVRDRYPSVRLLQTGSNLGFAGGNNAGARTARGRALVFLNNDTVPAPDWLARLHAALDERPEYEIASSKIVSLQEPKIVDSAGDGYFRAGGAYKHGHGGAAAQYDRSGEVFGACGAAFIIRRSLFETLGGFDERFFMVYEDVDLSYRARLLGHRCWYASNAVVRHAGSATLVRASPVAVFYGQRNLEWTWLKNTPRALLLRTAVPHVVYAMAGLLHYARTGRLLPAIRGKLAAIAGVPAVLRDRRAVQASATGGRGIEQMMDRGWLARKRREKAVLRF